MKTEIDQAYKKALEYIFHFVDYSLTHQENISPEKFNLERMRVFLSKLDNPHTKYKCIHVAGTKGKGSVSALCAGALQAQGYKVGLYTSPHLHEFTERIQVDRQPISKTDFAACVDLLKPVVEEVPLLTSYEIQTALAFLHFAKNEVDIAVIEVGLGGRLDSTNVINPLVSVITSLSLDHTSILGNSLAEIAREKGGIIKEKTPVVSAPQVEEASDELKKIAVEKQANYLEIGKDINFTRGEKSLEGQSLTINEEITLKITLLGPHQAENAALAYIALKVAKENGLVISDQSIMNGFKNTRWPGRFEIIQTKPTIIFDGAHNQYSAAMLVKTLKEYFPKAPITMIFGASEDKDIIGMFKELLPHTHTLIPVSSTHPRAATTIELAKMAAPYPCQIVNPKSIESAFNLAYTSIKEKGLVLVTGSIYLVGEARQVWITRFK